MRFLRLLLALGGLLGGGYVLGSTLLAVGDVFHELPFMDAWDQVFGYEVYCRGDLPISALWAQHNEHRILLQRLIFLVDFALCQGRGVFPIACSIALQLAQVCLLVWIVRQAAVLRRTELVFVAGIATAATFSAGQLENFYWPFQTQFFLIFANGLAAIAALHAALRDGSVRFGWLALSLLLAACATFSMANGVLAWPTLFLLALHRRAPKRALVAIAGLAVLTGIVFFAGYRLSEHGLSIDKVSPVRFLEALVHLYGNLLPPPAPAATPVLGAVSLLVASGFLLGFGWIRCRNPAVSAGMFAVLFLAGALTLIAIGRCGPDGRRIVASRYSTPLLLLWAYILPLAWVRARQAGSRVGAGLAVGALLAWGWLLVAIQPHAVAHHRPVHDRQVRAAMALVNDVRDEVAIRGSHDVGPDYLIARSRTLRAFRLSTFRYGWQDLIGTDLARAFAMAPGVLPHAAIESVHAVRGEPNAFRIEGWSWDPERRCGFDWIVLADRSGTILGIGEGGVLAPHAMQQDAAVTGDRAGWVGYVRLPPGTQGPVTIVAGALPAGLRTLRAIGGSCSTAAIWLEDDSSLGDPVTTEVASEGAWRRDGAAIPGPPPPRATPVYRSHAGGEAGRGELVLGPIVLPQGGSIGIPVLPGPVTATVEIRAVDADSGAEYARLRGPSRTPGWSTCRIQAPADRELRLRIVAGHDGIGAGAWFAVALPSWIGSTK